MLRGGRSFEARRDEVGTWHIRLGDGQRHSYDSLFVCNGHHWDCRWPDPAYQSQFEGLQVHSHSYRDPFTPVNFRGKRVLVVGMGNSAMDIATELCPRHIAQKLFVSTRRSTHIFPRFLLGKAAGAKLDLGSASGQALEDPNPR